MVNFKVILLKLNVILKQINQKVYQKSSSNFQIILRKIYQIFIIYSSRWKLIKAKKIFKNANLTPIWLERELLETLQKKYLFSTVFKYSEENIEQRSRNRVSEILKLIKSEQKDINKFLELGCGDGTICAALQGLGKKATGIDILDGFHGKALDSGAILRKMDVNNLKFEDESFDFVFSYDAFEHFVNPEKALQEAARVIRKNGYIYLSFGPLYMSPHGRHAYRSITIPYCQFLFPEEQIKEFIKLKGLRPLTEHTFNKWTIEDYRKLWHQYSPILKKIRYKEYKDPTHLDIVLKYPSCIKSKTTNFENLIISSIEVLFKKISN